MPQDLPPITDLLPPGTLPIGLGCSRLGSVNGASHAEARVLLQHALAQGVRFFDTSNIYGQGDSERLLAEALRQRDDCIICSKAGKYFDWKKRLLLPFKDSWRKLARNSGRTRAAIAKTRAKPMPTCWKPAFLHDSLHASLRRLKRQKIDIFMLHSPDAQVLLRGDAIGALEQARMAGKIGLIGVSVDAPEAAIAALADPRIRVMQLPLRPDEHSFDVVLQHAAAAGIAVIAREVLGGAAALAAARDPAAHAHAQITNMVRNPAVALTLLGTTHAAHLSAAVTAARHARDGFQRGLK